MKTLELRKNFYWTGIVDSNLRVFDIIMYTEFGTTYNSYVLKAGDKTVLFETAKVKFWDEYLEKVQEVTAVDEIDSGAEDRGYGLCARVPERDRKW